MLVEVDTNLVTGTSVTLPLRGNVNVSVDWGDGNRSTATSSGDLQHTYASNGSYTISITGDLEHFGASEWPGYPHTDAITGGIAWGDLGLTSLSGAFLNASNLASVPTSLPNTVTSTSGMFGGASAFNPPLATWNTSNVTNMSGMFGDASAFNQPLNTWNTSNVTEMERMLYGASAFNQPLDNWNTSNVTNMSDMFFRASTFNRDLSSWCVVNIPDPPEHFDDGATSWTLPRPVWGTCGDAPGPANDDFANAFTISGSFGSTTGSNVGATKEPGEPNHAGVTGGASVWWRWTAPWWGDATIDTFGSDFDTVLAVYTGSALGELTEVASNDDFGGLQSRVDFAATADTVYWIAVDGWGAATGSIALNWDVYDEE